MTDTPLKPCPFCGKPAEPRRTNYCACSDPNCFLSIDCHVETWNNRPVEDELIAHPVCPACHIPLEVTDGEFYCNNNFCLVSQDPGVQP